MNQRKMESSHANETAPHRRPGHAAAEKENYHMQDHDGNQVSLAEHIRSIVPYRIPNGTTQSVYEALIEMAGLADLGAGPRQVEHLRQAAQFLEQALDSLRCPEDPGEAEKGERPSPCPCCYAGEGAVGCWDRAYDAGFERGYREAAEYLPRFRASD